MRSLATVSYRNLTRRKGRYGLLAAGTALGVAVLFAVLVSNAATRDALDRDLNGATGRADVLVGPLGTFDATLPAGIDARVAALPAVVHTSTRFTFRTALAPLGVQGAQLSSDDQVAFVTGLDIGPARALQDFDLETGRFASGGAPELVVPHALAHRLGLAAGSAVEVTVPGGLRRVTVSGVLRDSGAALAEQGLVGYTALSTAQALDGRPGSLSAIDVELRPGTSRARWIAEARRSLGESVELSDASTQAAGFKGFLTALDAALTLVSVIALFVGGFLIFLTFSLAVAERTRVHGTLRALGALPRQIRRLVVTEAVVLSLVGGAGGLVLGYGLAAASVGFTSHLLGLHAGGLGLPLGDAVLSLAVAVAVSVAAAWLPGRRAARVTPVAAMRDGPPSDDRIPRPWAGLVLCAAGLALSLGGQRRGGLGQALGGLALLVFLLGAVLLVPWLLRPLAVVVGRATRRLGRGTGDIAVAHLVKERSRSAYTLALVMVVLAMILAVGASNQAISRSLTRVIDRQAGAGGDVQVEAPGAFDPAVAAQLAAVPGVRTVSEIRFGTAAIVEGGTERPVFLEVVDAASYFRVASFAWSDGTDAAARAALTAGGAVLLPETMAASLGVRRGGRISLRTGAGARPFAVAATYASVGTGAGVVAGRTDLGLLGAGRPNAYLLGLAPGTHPEDVRQTVGLALDRHYAGVRVDTAASLAAIAHRQVGGFFSIGYAMLAVAALIGMLGLANTLAVSVLTRTREIGMLRSSGMLRRQVRMMVVVEAETLAIVAFVLALPLAAVLAAGIIHSQRVGLGFSERFTYPWALVVPVGVAAALVAGLASAIPARRAGRLQPVAALRFD